MDELAIVSDDAPGALSFNPELPTSPIGRPRA